MKRDVLVKLAKASSLYLAKSGRGRRLSEHKISVIEKHCGKDFLRSMRKICSGELSSKSFWAAGNSYFCLNCDSSLVDHRGNSRSVCLSCIKSGVNPMDFKTQRTIKTLQDIHGEGCINVFQLENTKKKSKETLLQKYGYDNPSKVPEIQEQLTRILRANGKTRSKTRKETFTKKYGSGITHWSQVPELVEKFKDNLENTYGKGVTNVMHIKRVKATHANIMKTRKDSGEALRIYQEKCVPAMQKKFGFDNIRQDVEFMKKKRLESTGYEYPMQAPSAKKKFVDTCLERYGGTHPMHCSEVMNKSFANRRQFHLYEFTYKTTPFRVIGSYELFFLKYLLKKYLRKDVKTGFDIEPIKLAVSRRYYPDFFIKTKDLYIEVKSTYTLFGCEAHNWSNFYKNRKKAKHLQELGYNVAWVIPSPEKYCFVVLPRNWFDFSRKKLQHLVQSRLKAAESVQILSEGQLQDLHLKKFDSQV